MKGFKWFLQISVWCMLAIVLMKGGSFVVYVAASLATVFQFLERNVHHEIKRVEHFRAVSRLQTKGRQL
jgi:hypothetical protein